MTNTIDHVCPNGAKGWSDVEIRLNSCRRCGGPLDSRRIALAQGPRRSQIRVPTYEMVGGDTGDGGPVHDSEGNVRTRPVCKRCGSPLRNGYCTDATCPYSDYLQTDMWTEG